MNSHPTIGVLTLRPLDVDDTGDDSDLALLHDWVTRPYARFWDMQSATRDDVTAAYREIAGSPHHEAWVGLHDGVPTFLVERYDPRHGELADHYAAADGDVGMHFLVAPADQPLPGFSAEVLRTVMEFCFADPAVERVVVEPDVRNDKVLALNRAVGFEVVGTVELSNKSAALSICTRAQFHATTQEVAP